MNVEQFVNQGLGNSSYLVVSQAAHVAAVVDPLRDVDRYREAARRLGVDITHILDTHLHADFVSGARELAAQTGAVIGASVDAGLRFDHKPLTEGDDIRVGDFTLETVSTPGHTPEHISFVLRSPEGGKPKAIFSGGALIPGGAARTDLLGPELAEPLARRLFGTIRGKFLSLPDDTRVYPTHGGGSFCIASPVGDRTTTIGLERRRNPLVRSRTEDEFVRLALTGLPSYPPYFHQMRAINREGPKVLGGVPDLPPRSAREVRDLIAGGVAVLDVRPARAFVAGHIPESYGIDVGLGLAPWAGWLVPFGTPLVLVTLGVDDRDEAVRELIRIGYDDLRGYLDGGVNGWHSAGLPVESFPRVSVRELHKRVTSDDPPAILDVRFNAEWEDGHIRGAVHVEAGRLPSGELPLPKDRTIAAHCVHGIRSAAALSVLARRGYRDLVLIDGGVQEWATAGFDVGTGTDGA